MAYTAPAKDTVHFVGGLGTKADKSSTNGGGATQTAWDAGSPSDFMGANGGPTSDSTTWGGSQTACTVTDNGSSKCRITKNGGFGSCVIGTLANVDFNDATYDDGVYEVIAVNANYVDIELAYSADKTCDIKVGGAYDGLQNAVDNASCDAANYNRQIRTNLDETPGATIDIDTYGGTVAKDTWVEIIGCDSSFDKLAAGLYVTYDGEASYSDIIKINQKPAIRMKHIRLKSPSSSGAENVLQIYNSFVGWSGFVFEDCMFNDGPIPVYITGSNSPKDVVFRNCIIQGDGSFYAVDAIVHNIRFENCYLTAGSGGGLTIVRLKATNGTCIFTGCLFANNDYAIRTQAATSAVVHATHNVFYNIKASVYIPDATGVIYLYEHSNIYDVETVASDYVIYMRASSGFGNVMYEDYSITNATTYHYLEGPNHKDSASDTEIGFVDPSNDNFRSNSPLVLRGGMPDRAGNPNQMGAIIQKYQFPNRARLVNRGKVAILR